MLTDFILELCLNILFYNNNNKPYTKSKLFKKVHSLVYNTFLLVVSKYWVYYFGVVVLLICMFVITR